jgi:hypothetical protein
VFHFGRGIGGYVHRNGSDGIVLDEIGIDSGLLVG